MANTLTVEQTCRYKVPATSGSLTDDMNTVLNSSIPNIVVAWAETSLIRIMATHTEEVRVPGIQHPRAVLIVSDEPIDVSMANDIAGDPVFTGISSLTFLRFFEPETDYAHLKIRAGASDAKVRVFLAGDA